MSTTEEIMELVGDYARSCAHYRCQIVGPKFDAIRTAVEQLVNRAARAHHTPALLSEADAAADLAGVARPGAEPVAWLTEAEDGTVMLWTDFAEACAYCDDGEEPKPLYTTPPQASQPCDPAPDGVCESLECGNHGAEPVGWFESPYGAFRANPLHRLSVPSALLDWQVPLYLAPPQASQQAQDAVDAERYRWLRSNWFTMGAWYPDEKVKFTTGEARWSDQPESNIDEAIDAAIAAQKGKP